MNLAEISTVYGQNAFKLAVVVLLLVLMYALRKLRLHKYADSPAIKVVNSVSIGAKERIILLEANQTMLLIGATPSHITTLHVFNERETEKAMADEFDSLKSLLSEDYAPVK
ncbi:Flagellar protein FliO [Aquicella siphonis]|uniref:Flagellar protein n=1 Tax=Aquicella siphonis TaxID=254247 RepID=A0A5E4PJ29_9COXI|nr:flagellar biosynthetic protein FliO [Aquicella siphonis]VVC77079.1 Flagellar protein FliO [Aquicella siphonis]